MASRAVGDKRRDTRDRALGQLEREEGVALREIDDPVDDVGGPRRRRGGRDERGGILAIERSEVDLDRLAGPRQPRQLPWSGPRGAGSGR